MAGNVVREDVVQVSFEVESMPMQEIANEMNELKNAITGATSEGENSFKELADTARQMGTEMRQTAQDAATGFQDVTRNCSETSRAVNLINGSINQFDTGMNSAKSKATEFLEKLRSIASVGLDKLQHPITTIKTALGSAKKQACDFVTKLKDIGKTNLKNVINGISGIKNSLTQGKTGIAGFTTALRNIGKISVVGAVNGIKGVANAAKSGLSSLKELAKQKFDSLSSGLSGVGNKLSEMAAKAGEVALKIGKISAKGLLKGVGAAATAVVTGLGASIKVGKEFQSSMSQVAATMGTTAGTKEYETLSNAAKEMGATTAFSATEAAEALNYLALAGYDADKAAGALPTVLNLAGAGAMDLATASDMVTDSMSALGIEATQTNLTKFSDEMAVTAQKSNTSVQQLGEAILTVGGTAKGLAGGTTELNAALGVLANRGTKGAEGGTALRNILLSLQSPTDDAAAALQQLGVNVYDAEGNMRGINEIFKDLKKGMDGMSAAQQDSIISTLFNKTDLADARGMLEGCGDEFDNLVTQINGSAGACEAMYKTMLDNLDGDIAIFTSGLSALGNDVYEAIQEPLRGVVQEGTSLISDLNNALKEGGFEGLSIAVGDALAKVVQMITEYAPKILDLAVNMINGLVEGLVNNADSIADNLGAVLTSAVNAITQLVPNLLSAVFSVAASLADSLAAELPNILNSIIDGLTNVYDNIPSMVESGISIIMSLVEGIIQAIPTVVQSAPKVIHSMMEGILSSISLITESGSDLINALVNGIIECLPIIVSSAADTMTEYVNGLVSAIPLIINGALQLIQGLINGLIQCMPMIISSAIQLVMGLVQGLISALPNVINAAVQLIVGLIQSIVTFIPQLIAMGIQLIISLAVGLIQAIPQLVAVIPQIISAIWDGITSVNWLDLGVQIIKGIWDGIKSLGGAIWDGIKSVVTGGGNTSELDSIGQSTGASYGQSLANGLQATTPTTSSLASGLNIDLSAQGAESAQSWNNSFNSSLASSDNTGSSTATELQNSLNVDLTAQGTESAQSWNTGFVSGMSEESISAMSEQIKTSLTMDLTTQGTQSAQSWSNGFSTGITTANSILTTLTSDVANVVNQIATTIQTGLITSNNYVSTSLNTMKTAVSGAMSSIVTNTQSGIQSFNSTLKSGMSTAVNTVSSAMSKLKSLMNFKWELPKLKLPHFKINGSFSLNPPKAPSFGVEWYKNGGIMTKPTMFGMNGNNAMVGGEAGAEAVLPLEPFWDKLDDSISKYSPENDSTVYNTNETNIYSPTYKLTISGSNEDRMLERKVRKWIKEANNEYFESLARRTGAINAQ